VRSRLKARGRPEPQQFSQNAVAGLLCFPNRAVTAATPAEVSEGGNSNSGELPVVAVETEHPQKESPGMPPAVPAGVPEPDWQPAPVGRWRPEREIPYPGDEYFKQQRSYLYLLDKAWAGLKKEFKTVRRRLHVPFHVRSPSSIATWLHHSTGDIRWLVIAESIEIVQDRKGYRSSGVNDPYAAVSPAGHMPPRCQLTMDTVNAYCARVDQLRADSNKLTDLHADARE
jgi:hypothetical protein